MWLVLPWCHSNNCVTRAFSSVVELKHFLMSALGIVEVEKEYRVCNEGRAFVMVRRHTFSKKDLSVAHRSGGESM